MLITSKHLENCRTFFGYIKFKSIKDVVVEIVLSTSIDTMNKEIITPDGWSLFAVGNLHKLFLYSDAHHIGVWNIAPPIFGKEYKNSRKGVRVNEYNN